MSNSAVQPEISPELTGDSRWALVERIVTSPSFVKSPRLCSILLFICELSLSGRNNEINELNIGETLFGRAPNYDPSIDGIVRSHASRLRQRLEQYFNEEGAHETIRLSIPRGGYIPVFEARSSSRAFPELSVISTSSNSSDASSLPHLPTSSSILTVNRALIWILSAALALACGYICYLVGLRHLQTGMASRPIPVTEHPLWSRLFVRDHSTTVICSDTGLTILENLTRNDVTLADYLSGDYRTNMNAPLGATPEVVRVLAEHRYTSIVDLEIVSKLYRTAGLAGDHIQVRYSRDVRPNDLKRGSIILLGTQEGTPWIELFADRMNFVLQHNRQWGEFSVLNRSPRGNEAPQYNTSKTDPLHKVYGLVALRPNLGRDGFVLILEGTSMAGTESAADFVFDDSRLLPFLDKIRRSDGSLPYFELLLQSINMNGNASQSEIVGYRTSAE